MRYLFAILLFFTFNAHAQTYVTDIQDWRSYYKEDLLGGNHPLKTTDTAFVNFFPVDENYRITATFEMVTGTRPFLLENKHGGIRKAVREYGYVYFNLLGANVNLVVYRFANMDNNAVSGGLFIPFTDGTNYNETFLGGRYLDVNIDSIKNNRVVLDFNKAYNPHTAYEKGYPYMIVPSVNHLRIDINAGEKIFGKNPGY